MLVEQGKRTKKRRPSLTKMKIKLPIKGKTRELSKKNHVQVCFLSDGRHTNLCFGLTATAVIAAGVL
jgi:hypothetical protein